MSAAAAGAAAAAAAAEMRVASIGRSGAGAASWSAAKASMRLEGRGDSRGYGRDEAGVTPASSSSSISSPAAATATAAHRVALGGVVAAQQLGRLGDPDEGSCVPSAAARAAVPSRLRRPLRRRRNGGRAVAAVRMGN